MKYHLWCGSIDALSAAVEVEKTAREKMSELMDRRGSFILLNDGEDEDKPVNMGDWLIDRQGDVGIIKVHGSLVNSHAWFHQFFPGEITSYDAIRGAAYSLAAEEGIERIALDIRSGGGQVMGLHALGKDLRRVAARKKLIAFSSTAAFSAAYWIASSASEIVGTEMAEFGSIGTLAIHASMSKLYESMGVEFTVFRAGKYKAIGLPQEELSEEDKEYLQKDIDAANAFFLEHVSLRRNLHVSAKAVWAEGQTFFAEEARSKGLIDRIGSLEDIIVSAAGANTNRSLTMDYAEKLQAIAAGANPEDVLTAEELKRYQAELESGKSASEPGNGAGEGEGGNGEEEEEPEPGKDKNGEPIKDANAGGQSAAAANDALRQAYRENGKLEAKVEELEAKLATATSELSARSAQVKNLMEVSKIAVNKMQVALGKPKESADSAEGVVQMYNDLSAEMSNRFSAGRQSSTKREEENGEGGSVTHMPLAFRNSATKR